MTGVNIWQILVHGCLNCNCPFFKKSALTCALSFFVYYKTGAYDILLIRNLYILIGYIIVKLRIKLFVETVRPSFKHFQSIIFYLFVKDDNGSQNID